MTAAGRGYADQHIDNDGLREEDSLRLEIEKLLNESPKVTIKANQKKIYNTRRLINILDGPRSMNRRSSLHEESGAALKTWRCKSALELFPPLDYHYPYLKVQRTKTVEEYQYMNPRNIASSMQEESQTRSNSGKGCRNPPKSLNHAEKALPSESKSVGLKRSKSSPKNKTRSSVSKSNDKAKDSGEAAKRSRSTRKDTIKSAHKNASTKSVLCNGNGMPGPPVRIKEEIIDLTGDEVYGYFRINYAPIIDELPEFEIVQDLHGNLMATAVQSVQEQQYHRAEVHVADVRTSQLNQVQTFDESFLVRILASHLIKYKKLRDAKEAMQRAIDDAMFCSTALVDLQASLVHIGTSIEGVRNNLMQDLQRSHWWKAEYNLLFAALDLVARELRSQELCVTSITLHNDLKEILEGDDVAAQTFLQKLEEGLDLTQSFYLDQDTFTTHQLNQLTDQINKYLDLINISNTKSLKSEMKEYRTE